MSSPRPTAYPYDVELAAAVPYLPSLDYNDVATARAISASFVDMLPPADLTDVSYRDVAIPVSAGSTITMRITTPDRVEKPLPVIYDIHPGGFCLGSAAEMHGTDAVLAREVGAIVVSVDYRLAPEHPYPTPLEDCYAGLQWIVDNADEFGADPQRIAVYGQSAGGGLAAGLVLLARDRGGPPVSFQYLAFPELDDRLGTPSMKRFVDTPLLHRANAEASWRAYLGDVAPGAADVPMYAAPARATDLAGLPPAYVAVMQFDPLRDEGMAYAQKLLDADVNVELHLFRGRSTSPGPSPPQRSPGARRSRTSPCCAVPYTDRRPLRPKTRRSVLECRRPPLYRASRRGGPSDWPAAAAGTPSALVDVAAAQQIGLHQRQTADRIRLADERAGPLRKRCRLHQSSGVSPVGTAVRTSAGSSATGEQPRRPRHHQQAGVPSPTEHRHALIYGGGVVLAAIRDWLRLVGGLRRSLDASGEPGQRLDVADVQAGSGQRAEQP